MITFRNSACAFLRNNGDFLLMKRSQDRKIAPGFWSAVGGHIEPDEVNNPRKACLREIYEETGICESEIDDLVLKYIILRRSRNEIRLVYIYFGKSRKREVIDTDEGKLFWIPKNELLDREFTSSFRITLNHYLEAGYITDDILVGAVRNEGGKPYMNWTPLQDWEN